MPSCFADMHIKVGDPLHLEPPRPVAGGRATASLLGWLDGASVMVTAPVNAAGRLALQEGELLVLRAFTGRSAFAFRATVLRVAYQPFAYLHLSFPDKIDVAAIRSSPRCRVSLPARIGAGGRSCDGRIVNIGTNGALIETAGPVSKDQSPIQVAFSFELHGVAVALDLQADLCGEKITPEGGGESRCQYGVAFTRMQPNDRLILGSLVWYRMYEDPRSVT